MRWQSAAFSDAVVALPATAPSTAPANSLPALGAALSNISPLSVKAAQCSAIAAALTALRTAQASPLLNGTAADIAGCAPTIEANDQSSYAPSLPQTLLRLVEGLAILHECPVIAACRLRLITATLSTAVPPLHSLCGHRFTLTYCSLCAAS